MGKTSSRPPPLKYKNMQLSQSRYLRSPEPLGRSTSTRPLSRGLAGADSGFDGGRRKMSADIVGGSPARVRDSLTSYLFPFSPHANLTHPYHNLATPPLSHSHSSNHVDRFSSQQPHSMPLTPVSPPQHLINIASGSQLPATCPPSPASSKPNQPIIPLLAALFPYQATQASAHAQALDIITPPSTVLHGFYIDSNSSGRTVYVHLPPLPADQLSSGLSVRDSITALLDLAETLGGSSLILVLDREEREDSTLADLLHSLLYVGLELCHEVPGRYEFDTRQWVLLGIEL